MVDLSRFAGKWLENGKGQDGPGRLGSSGEASVLVSGLKREAAKSEGGWSKGEQEGPSLVVQHLRVCASNAGGLGSIPGRGTRPHMLQLRPATSKLNKSIKIFFK